MIVDQFIINKKIKDRKFEDDKNFEKPFRSVAKAFSWRLIGTLDTLLVSYLLSGTFSLAASIASIDFLTKLVLYFFHERVWNTIKWGK